jgi:hypothetical protein
MDQASEPAEGMPQGQDPAAESGPAPGVPGLAPPPSYALPPSYAPHAGFDAPPSLGSSPPGTGQAAYYGQWYPTAPRARNKRKVVIIVASVGAAIILLAGGLITLGRDVLSHLNSTANVLVIVPPPSTAGGLNQDYRTESTPRFQHILVTLRHNIEVHEPRAYTSYTLALYTNALPGAPDQTATVIVQYAGYNTASLNYDTAAQVRSALAGAASKMTSVRTLPITAGFGNTRYGCESGFQDAVPAATCVWATDRTIGTLFEYGSTSNVASLAVLVKKMEPDLVTG